MSETTPPKLDPSFWLSLFFVVLIAVWLVTAADFGWDTRLFPWAIGIPALVLALRQLVTDWRGIKPKPKTGEKEAPSGILDISVDKSIPPEEVFRHTIRTAYWILGFACGIWFVGFLITIPFFIYSYLVSEAKAAKLPSFLVASLTTLFVWGLFEQVVHLAWPEAELFTLLGIKF